MRSKSMDWFLYDNGFRHKRVNHIPIFMYLLRFILRFFFLIFHDRGPYHIETNLLICSANQCACAYQGVRNVRFSENLAYFVFLKHPFWDSYFCPITDVILPEPAFEAVNGPFWLLLYAFWSHQANFYFVYLFFSSDIIAQIYAGSDFGFARGNREVYNVFRRIFQVSR